MIKNSSPTSPFLIVRHVTSCWLPDLDVLLVLYKGAAHLIGVKKSHECFQPVFDPDRDLEQDFGILLHSAFYEEHAAAIAKAIRDTREIDGIITKVKWLCREGAIQNPRDIVLKKADIPADSFELALVQKVFSRQVQHHILNFAYSRRNPPARGVRLLEARVLLEPAA